MKEYMKNYIDMSLNSQQNWMYRFLWMKHILSQNGISYDPDIMCMSRQQIREMMHDDPNHQYTHAESQKKESPYNPNPRAG